MATKKHQDTSYHNCKLGCKSSTGRPPSPAADKVLFHIAKNYILTHFKNCSTCESCQDGWHEWKTAKPCPLQPHSYSHDLPDWTTAQELQLSFHFMPVQAQFWQNWNLSVIAAMLLKFGFDFRIYEKWLLVSASKGQTTEAQIIWCVNSPYTALRNWNDFLKRKG